MKTLLKDCKKCWVISGILVILILSNAFQLVHQGYHHQLSMPLFLKILNFMI